VYSFSGKHLHEECNEMLKLSVIANRPKNVATYLKILGVVIERRYICVLADRHL
jgi:hypothetical protein